MLSLASNKSGATLIELLISLAILSVISVAFLNVITGSIRLRNDSDLIKRASAIASSKIESIKSIDQAPSELSQSEVTADGYTVMTVYTETTNTLNLTNLTLPQKDISFYNLPVFELTINDQIAGQYSGTQITPVSISDLSNTNMELRISKVENTVNLLEYELIVNTLTGIKRINIGTQTLSETVYKAAKITVGKQLLQSINLTVNDDVSEHLQIGIFDDELSRLQTQISGSNAAVKIENGLLSEAANSQLQLHYYDVVVSVSKNGHEYSRVLTTWAVGQ